MRVKVKHMIVAVMTIIFLTILPLTASKLIPEEFFKVVYTTTGINLMSILNKVSLIGFVLAILIISKSMFEKSSKMGLILSISSKVFWFIVVLFILGLGRVENFGLAMLNSENENVSNTVILDLQLIAFLTSIIVFLKIVNSVLEFKERSQTIPINQ